MLRRECVTISGVVNCQIPYNENGISGITNFLGLLFFCVFAGIAFWKLLNLFFK